MVGKGRVCYIEPTTDVGNNKGSGYPAPLEDYDIAVDLKIIKGNRYACGLGDENGQSSIMEFSSENGTIDFLGGTNGYVGTNFTEISMSDTGGNTNECLGIKSINIDYKSWRYPQITIVFTDIRGASLIGKEEAYIDGNSQEPSFFNELFRFPYPLFRMTVKGYYGNAVTYDLSLHNTMVSFNSQTGNFDVTASFIGYSYGAYSDMPMTYLAAAPYMTYKGRNYWNEMVETKKFVFTDNTPMIKLPEFRRRVASALQNEDYQRLLNDWQRDVGGGTDQKAALEKLINEYPYKEWNEPEMEDKNGSKYPYLLYVAPLTSRLSLTDMEEQRKTFYTDLKAYSQKYDNVLFDFDFMKSSNIIEENLVPAGGALKNADYLKYIEDEIAQYSDSGYYLYIVKKYNRTKIDDCQAFKEKINLINKQIDKDNENYRTAERSALTKLLGFTPSVRNIFNLIFAHYETFARSYYDCLTEIKSQLDRYDAKRLPDSYGLSINDTDISTFAKSNYIPPFTGIFKERNIGNSSNREMIWPGELMGGANLEEVGFVDALIEACKFYSTEQATINQALNTDGANIDGDIYRFIPLTSYDYRYNESIDNPYACCKNLADEGKDIRAQVCMTLFLRGYYFLLQAAQGASAFNSKESIAHSVGYIEALNFYKAMGHKMSDSLYNMIRQIMSFSSMLTNRNEEDCDEWNVGTGLPVIYNGSRIVNYNWIKSDNDRILPIGEHCLSGIKRDVGEGSYVDNSKYLNLDKWKGTRDSFGINESRSYFKDVIDNISAMNFGEYSDMLSTSTDFIKKVMSREYNPVYDDVSYKSGAISIGNKELKNILATGDYQDTYIRNPSFINENDEQSLYGHPFYYLQDSIADRSDRLKAKAYLFLFSIPLRGNVGNYGIVKKCTNGTELQVRLLREGAAYWRAKQMKENGGNDVIVTDGKFTPIWNYFQKDEREIHYKKADINQVYCSTGVGYETLAPLKKNSILGYGSYEEPEGLTESRRNVLIERFEAWATNEFARIDELLRDKDVYHWELTVNQTYFRIDETNHRIYGLYLETNAGNRDVTDIKTKKQIELQRLLKDLMFGVWSVVDVTAGVSYGINKVRNMDISNVFVGFKRAIDQLYKEEVAKYNNPEGEKGITDRIEETFGSMDVRLSTYMTLKNLYDRWFCTSPFSRWDFKSDKSDFSRFIYIDSYYNDIGDRLLLNTTQISDILSKFLPEGTQTNDDISVYSFLSTVAQISHGGLATLPAFYGNASRSEIEKIFSVFPRNDDKYKNKSHFVFLYEYTMSRHLDVDDGYTDDAFDYTDLPPCLAQDDGVVVPCFGVSYAQQNQAFFQNIKLTTEAPRVTDWSIQAQYNISGGASRGPRETTLFGQDIYSIYSQNSYECSVDMMGDAQILPLMYFQLNGIPMWHGMYQIQGVTHEIVNKSMTTKFWGTRMSKVSIPMVDDSVMTENTTAFNPTSNKTTGTIGMENNYVVKSTSNEGAAYEVWNHVFNVLRLGGKGSCAKYTYQLAAGYVGMPNVVYGGGSNATRANGNAKQASFWDSLTKLGYRKVYDKVLDTPSSQMASEVNKLSCTPGDVVVYYATESNSASDSAYVYGHAQFYVNDTIGWTSSVKYNYNPNAPGKSFVYGNRSGCRKWRLVHFKAPAAGSYDA